MKLKQRINNLNKYGVSINPKKFILEALLIIGGIIGIAFLLQLKSSFLLCLVLESLIFIPLILIAYAKQIRSLNKFNLLTDYLSNALPIFLQKSKILYTLQELRSITSNEMAIKIDEAISYLEKTNNDPQAYQNALKIIEDAFPNSRLKSLHKFLLDVESYNSTSFKELASNLYEDIEAWIKRTFLFQQDLKNKRNKLIILCILTILMDTLFIYVYGSNEFFVGYTDSLIYQVSTTIFVSLIEIITVIILSRLNGNWLIDDLSKQNEERLIKQYQIVCNQKPKLQIKDFILIAVCLALAYYFKNNTSMLLSMLIITVIVIINKPLNYYKAHKSISRLFKIEFPLWLREVSLSLGNLTVLNAINETSKTMIYPLRKEIRKFLLLAYKNPTSIKPYNEFLASYDLEDVRGSMRILYALNNTPKEEIHNRVSNLISRNQDLLAKSESLKNNDALGYIEAVGYLPLLLFSIQALISMFLMFSYMIESLSLQTIL